MEKRANLEEQGRLLEDLTEDHRQLGLEEALMRLSQGEVMVVRKMETALDMDTLVRINYDHRVPVTEISYNVKPPKGIFKPDRYWVPFDVTINSLSYAQVFRFDEADTIGVLPEFKVGDIVFYTSTDGQEDSAVITKVWREYGLATTIGTAIIGKNFIIGGDPISTDKYWYSLTRDTEVYSEEELTLVKHT